LQAGSFSICDILDTCIASIAVRSAFIGPKQRTLCEPVQLGNQGKDKQKSPDSPFHDLLQPTLTNASANIK